MHIDASNGFINNVIIQPIIKKFLEPILGGNTSVKIEGLDIIEDKGRIRMQIKANLEFDSNNLGNLIKF